MTLSPKILGVVAAISAGAIAGAIGTVAHSPSSSTPVEILEAIRTDVAQIKSDVRLLKCEGGFPGDCPGQAKRR